MIGAEHNRAEISTGDTYEAISVIYKGNGQAASESDVTSVEFKLRKPDGVTTTHSGIVQADGSGFYRFVETEQTGLYVWTATFTLITGERRTYRDEFYVTNPLEAPPDDRKESIANEVWMRLEDCFDSELGGPWLRDKTLAYFDPGKVARFIPEGLLMINVTPPDTQLDLGYFTTDVPETDPVILANDPQAMQADPDRILIVQATLIAVIRHLMRSYTEQPNLVGGNVAWQDRRDYLQRWGTILQIEEKWFHDYVLLWKRQFYSFGKSALLVHSKAGRLYPPGYRARHAVRGY